MAGVTLAPLRRIGGYNLSLVRSPYKVMIMSRQTLSPAPAVSLLTGLWFLFCLQPALAQPPRAPRPPDGPWNHQIHFATSADGLRWDAGQQPIMKQASVPDILELSRDTPAGARGTLLVYTVDARDIGRRGGERISRLVSTDGGQTWSRPAPILLDRRPGEGNTVDPSVVELDDGRLRLYFYLMRQGPPRPGEPHRFYSAVSRDGLHFELEDGVRLESPNVTDPEVIRAGDEWLMFFTRRGDVLMARSADGLEFRTVPGFRVPRGGIPGAIAAGPAAVRLYLTGRGGITSAVYHLRTERLEPEPGARIPGPAADPSVWRRTGGGYVMIFKRWIRLPRRLPPRPRAAQSPPSSRSPSWSHSSRCSRSSGG